MTGINSYSTTASENVQANTGINWDEGMAPGQVNNSARQNMADIRAAFDDLIWFQYGIGSKAVTHAYASATSTTITGADVTAVYHAGRRIKATGSSTGTIYGKIVSSSYSGSTTTINYRWDSGALSSEPLTIYLSQVPVTGNPAGLHVENRYTNFTGFAPTGSSSFAQMGLGSSWILTPNSTGRVRITVIGTMGNLTASGGAQVIGSYGTGTAPANGASISGIARFTTTAITAFSYTTSANIEAPYCYIAEVSGLTLGTQYWFDLQVQNQNFGTGFANVASVIIEEL